MKIVTRKLNNETHGPDIFAVVNEQELIGLGYVWEFAVFNDVECYRVGYSKIKTEQELRAYIVSGLSRIEWEAMHS